MRRAIAINVSMSPVSISSSEVKALRTSGWISVDRNNQVHWTAKDYTRAVAFSNIRSLARAGRLYAFGSVLVSVNAKASLK